MARNNLAYNFEAFETAPKRQPEQQPKKAPIQKVGHNPYTRVAILGISPWKAVAILLVVIGVAATMLYSNVALADTMDSINSKTTEYTQLESENSYMQLQLESLISLKNAESYAADVLGLQKIDSSQIEYISLTQGNHIETSESASDDFFDSIVQFFSNLLS